MCESHRFKINAILISVDPILFLFLPADLILNRRTWSARLLRLEPLLLFRVNDPQRNLTDGAAVRDSIGGTCTFSRDDLLISHSSLSFRHLRLLLLTGKKKPFLPDQALFTFSQKRGWMIVVFVDGLYMTLAFFSKVMKTA